MAAVAPAPTTPRIVGELTVEGEHQKLVCPLITCLCLPLYPKLQTDRCTPYTYHLIDVNIIVLQARTLRDVAMMSITFAITISNHIRKCVNSLGSVYVCLVCIYHHVGRQDPYAEVWAGSGREHFKTKIHEGGTPLCHLMFTPSLTYAYATATAHE
jgi:hypothetical protein